MAVTLTNQWQALKTGSFSFTYSGLSYSMETAVDGYAVQASNTTATVWLRGWIHNTGVNGWTGTNKVYRISVTDSQGTTVYDSGGTQDSATIPANSSHHVPSSVGSACFTGTSGATYRVTFYYNIPVGGGTTISEDVIVPTYATPPTGLTASNISSTTNSFTATVSVSGWGTEGSATASDYYKTLRIHAYTDSGLSNTFRYTRASGISTSDNITVNNSSPLYSGSLTLSANTRYVMSVFASNGTVDTGAIRTGIVYTTPNTPSMAETGQSYYTYNRINCPVSISVPADGGALTKTLYFRYKKGSGSWSDWADTLAGTISGGSATTKTFTPVFDADSTYTLEVRSTTSAGSSASTSITITTMQVHRPPYVGQWDFVDTNTDVFDVLGQSDVFIQGMSIPQMSISINSMATYDSVSLASVVGEFDGNSVRLTRSGQYYQALFSAPENSGTLSAELTATDALQASTTDSKDVQVLPYAEPTIILNFERVDVTGVSNVSVAGRYASLTIDNVDKNVLTSAYKITHDGTTLVDWTTFPLTADEQDQGFKEYSALLENLPTTYQGTFLVQVRIQDAFSSVVESIEISSFSDERVLKITQYDVEVWTNQGYDANFVADISSCIEGTLNINWTLNDIEEVSFDVSLDAIETLKATGLVSGDFLEPYRYDIRIRRNGAYVIGCQIVEANIEIGDSQIPKMKIRGTGFLNLFKDRYVTLPLASYTYPALAHKLLTWSQSADNLIPNGTGDIDASYWISPVSTITSTTSSRAGARAIQAYSASGYVHGMGIKMQGIPAGTQIIVKGSVLGASGQAVYIRERDLINRDSTQGTVYTIASSTQTGAWYDFTSTVYTTKFTDGYIYIEQNRTATPLRVDNLIVARANEISQAYNDFKVQTAYGSLLDTITYPLQMSGTSTYTGREISYDLQNVKDAVLDLCKMEDDNFDFYFTPDRKFYTTNRKGQDRDELFLEYPGNISSFSASRSAANLVNKIVNIGSGIGDERLQSTAVDDTSQGLLGTRVSILTNNNVSQTAVLKAQAEGQLKMRKQVSQELSVVIKDGSIHCGNVQTGDSLPFVTNAYQGVLAQQPSINTISLDGVYRILCQIDGELFALSAEDVTSSSGANPRACFKPFDSADVMQQWKITPTGESGLYFPYYTLENCGIPRLTTSNYRFLDVLGNTFEDQQPVQCYESNNVNAQKWQIKFYGDAPYTNTCQIEAYNSGFYLNHYSTEGYEACISDANAISFTLQKVNAPTELSLVKGLEGWYKIKKMNVAVSNNSVETTTLTLDYEGTL